MSVRPSTLAGPIVFAVLALAPLVLDDWRLGELSQFLAYGILAMSLALIWGQAGLLCFGQAVFFGLGAYAMSFVTLGMVPGLAAVTSTWAGLAAAIAAPAVAANVVGRFLFYGRGLRGAYFGIATLAIAVVVERLFINWGFVGGLNGLMNVPPLDLGLAGWSYELWEPVPLYAAMLAAAALVWLGLEAVVRSPFGSVLRAIAGSEERTAAFGYDTAGCKLSAFTLSAAVAGFAGALFSAQFAFVSPPLIGFALSTEALIWVAVGGRGALIAAFLGAILVKSAEARLSEALGASWLLALGLLFVACVVLLPRGVVGEVLARLDGWWGRGRKDG